MGQVENGGRDPFSSFLKRMASLSQTNPHNPSILGPSIQDIAIPAPINELQLRSPSKGDIHPVLFPFQDHYANMLHLLQMPNYDWGHKHPQYETLHASDKQRKILLPATSDTLHVLNWLLDGAIDQRNVLRILP